MIRIGRTEGLEAGLAEGHAAGRVEGHEFGRIEQIETLIRKKLVKNKALEQIADELETSVEEILPIDNRLLEEIKQM